MKIIDRNKPKNNIPKCLKCSQPGIYAILSKQDHYCAKHYATAVKEEFTH